MLTTIKLFSPLYGHLCERDDWGNLDYDSVDMGADELCAYQDVILEAIEREHLDTEGDRGLAVYLDNAMLKRKVHSMKPSVEEWNGRLWGVLEVQSYGQLSQADLAKVIEEWSGQESDGWGEGFEQREIAVDSGELGVSFWSSDKSFFIKTEQELKAQQPHRSPMRTQVNITADEYRGKRGYHCLNLHAVFQKGTVEFRLFNGTLHAGKIKAYIQFCLAIGAQALNQSCASRRKTQTTNEKYTFRTWLLRLGLNGDEFSTARQHLLDNLDGCIAWRDPAQAEAQKERLRQKREKEREQARQAQADMEPVVSDQIIEENEQAEASEEVPAFTMSM